MVRHSGGLYTEHGLIILVITVISFLHALITLWWVHMHKDVYYNNLLIAIYI